MNGTELIATLTLKIDESNLSIRDFLEGMEESTTQEFESMLGSWTIVDHKRLDPNEYLYVVRFKKHNIFLAFNVGYSSWSGSDYSDTVAYEVIKAEKTVSYWKEV